MITISGLIYLFNTFVSWFYSCRILGSSRREKTPFKYFALGGVFIGLATFMYGFFSFVAPTNSFLLETGYIIGHFFITIGLFFMVKTVCKFLENKILVKIIQSIALLTIIILTAVDIYYFGSPTIDKYGLIHWNQQIIPQITIVASAIILSGIVGIIYLTKSPEGPQLKSRSVFMAVAFLVGGIGGGMVCVLDNTVSLFISYFLFGLGFLSALLVSFIPV